MFGFVFFFFFKEEPFKMYFKKYFSFLKDGKLPQFVAPGGYRGQDQLQLQGSSKQTH